MALNKIALKTGIKSLTDELWANAGNLTPEQCRDKFATDLSNLIEVFVKTGLVTTTGTAAAQTGNIT